MKEIIYLDTNLVNSLLAQQNAGVITKLVNEDGESDAKTEGSTEQTTISSDVGLSALLKATGGYSSTNVDSYNFVFSKSNKNLVETALDDYSLDLLITGLEAKNLIKHSDYQDGDLISVSGELTVFNFEQLAETSDLEEISSLLPEYDEFKALKSEYGKIKGKEKHLRRAKEIQESLLTNGWNIFETIKHMSVYLKKLLPETNLIKISNTFSILPLEFLRVQSVQLSFMQFGKRKIKMLGICSSTFDEQIPSDFSHMEDSNLMLKYAPTTILNIILGSFGMIDKDDHLVRPIAIYFED
ncbi:DUF6414 family protein [Streptococcus salivarius]|uniref:DUF6414 family protein n=1 Tax=Streptococcus salivarius TaxID=1304 RepID=UPI001C029AC7|nr:hypothetical protein [Streptococcus salivarius]MBT9630218.1 hypothetical protein [Streptococcus salivarius]